MKTKEIFPERLREIRTKKNLTIYDLAELSGVSKSAISKYELGESVPSVETAIALAKVLNVSLTFLLGEEVQHEEIIEYVNKILRKHNVNAPYIDTTKMTTDDLQRFEDDIILALKIVVEKWKGR